MLYTPFLFRSNNRYFCINEKKRSMPAALIQQPLCAHSISHFHVRHRENCTISKIEIACDVGGDICAIWNLATCRISMQILHFMLLIASLGVVSRTLPKQVRVTTPRCLCKSYRLYEYERECSYLKHVCVSIFFVFNNDRLIS